MSFTSQTNSGYVNSIQTATNVVSNATGVSDIEVIGQNLSNVQKMVNYDTKSIFTNIIGKYDKSPIEVIDPINLSNTFYVGGTQYSGSGSGTSGSGTSLVAGLTNVSVFSNASTTASVIKFVTNSTIAARFDGYGNFLYSPGPSTGTFEISGNLLTHAFNLSTSSNVSSMYLRGDSAGNASWHPLDTIGNSNVRLDAVSNGTSSWQQGFRFSQLNSNLGIVSTLGYIDGNGIWSVGVPDYVLNADLKSSNNMLVTSNIRFKPADGQVGSFLRAANIYGDLDYVAAGTINTYLTNQIVATNNRTSVLADLSNISFAINGGEVVRINSNGFLGLANPLPMATLDNSNATILRSTVRLTNLYPGYTAQKGFVLTTIDSAGTAAWQNISSLTDALGNSISLGISGAPVALIVNGQKVFYASTTSNLIASGGSQTMTLDVSGVVIAQQYRGTGDTIKFTDSAGTIQASISPAGNMGISNNLAVAGNVNAGGLLTVGTTLTVGYAITGNQQIIANGGFSGDGSLITNINPTNVGAGSNNLTFFYGDTRANLAVQSTQTSQNLSTVLGLEASNFSALSTLVSTTSYILMSSLSTQIYGTWFSLSTTAGGNVSTLYSTINGVSNGLSTLQGIGFSTLSTGLATSFSSLSSYLFTQGSSLQGIQQNSSNYFSSFISTVYSSNLASVTSSVGSLSTLIGPGYYAVSAATYAYINQQFSTATSIQLIADEVRTAIQSTFTFNQLNVGVGLPAKNLLSTNYTLDISGSALFHNGPVYMSTVVGVEYPYGSALMGALDVNGLVYACGYGSKGPLGPQFYRTGSTLGGFAADNRLVVGQSSLSYFGTGMDISGNINLTGNLYVNDNEINLSPTWNKIGSNVTYTLGNVGIGTTIPQNSLDVAGTIRCQALQIVGFVDPGSGQGNTGDVSLINIRTSTLVVSTINSFPAFPVRSGWSDVLLQSSLTTTAKVVCSTTVTLNASSFLMATANHNMVNTTGIQRAGYTYLTVNGAMSQSTMITLAPLAGASVSLGHRIYEGPGTWTVATWAYADAGAAVLGIRADVSATGNMF